MEDNRVTRFSVLMEAEDSCRLDPTVPVSGHAVLTLEGDRGELTIYLRNLRPLRDIQPPGLFYYEGWLVDPAEGPTRAVSLGAFNSDEAGSAKGYLPFSPSNLRGTGRSFSPEALLMITAEPMDGNLEPNTCRVMLGVFGPPAPVPALVDLRATVTPEAGKWAPEPVGETAVQAQEVQAQEVQATVQDDQAQTAQERAAQAQPWSFPNAPFPPLVCPPGYEPVDQTHEPLIPLRDRLRESTGSATIDFAKSSVLLTVRGVPAPSLWGIEPTTGRPYNVYEAWLHNSRTGEWASLGLFRKIWQDTFRLQYRGELPLHLYDTIVVSPEDRTSSGDPARIPLLSASYLPYTQSPAGAGAGSEPYSSPRPVDWPKIRA